MPECIKLQTEKNSIIELTSLINEILEKKGVKDGLCAAFVPHTTAAITVNSACDPLTHMDIVNEIRRLVPTRVDFMHQHDTPEDAAAHVKSTLIGCSAIFIIENGKLVLGDSQGVFFLEFDGPRERKCYLKIISGEKE